MQNPVNRHDLLEPMVRVLLYLNSLRGDSSGGAWTTISRIMADLELSRALGFFREALRNQERRRARFAIFNFFSHILLEVMCLARDDSKWLDNVLRAFWELGVNKAHRRQIAEKVREIRESEGLHLGNYVAWTQYVLGHYSRARRILIHNYE